MKPVNVDYFTDAIRYTQVRVLEIAEEETIAGPAARAHGDVLVRSQVVGFKKIKFFTNENVGAGKLELPENEMHATSFWLTLGHGLLAELPFSLSERQSGIFGLLYALGSMATLLMMCDRRDLGTAVGEHPPSAATEINWQDFSAPANASEAKEFFEPNLYIYDNYPGGIGFSEPLYRACDVLLARTLDLISACSCENGCPSCVGPTADRSERTKHSKSTLRQGLVPNPLWNWSKTPSNVHRTRDPFVVLEFRTPMRSSSCRAANEQRSSRCSCAPFRSGVRGGVGQAGRDIPPACRVELSDLAARRCGLIAARLASRRDFLSTSALENFFRPFDFVGSVGVNGKQDAAILHSALVTLRFVFRNAHADKRSGETAHGSAYTRARECGYYRTGCDERPQARNRERPNARQPSQTASKYRSGAGACGCTLGRLGVLLMREIPGALFVREKRGNIAV